MTKQWYLDFDGKVEGPFSVEELLNDERVTLETLVWRVGFDEWVPVKNVPELKQQFKNTKTKKKVEDEEKAGLPPDEEIALDLGWKGPPVPSVWVVFALLIAGYVLYRLIAG